MISNCKASSIASTTFLPDTLPTISLDSVKILVPRGYYVLNEQGAKLSLKAKIDAKAYFDQWKLTDNALNSATSNVFFLTLENSQAKEKILIQAETIRLMEKSLFWANFWKYTGMVGSAILTTKLILK